MEPEKGFGNACSGVNKLGAINRCGDVAAGTCWSTLGELLRTCRRRLLVRSVARIRSGGDVAGPRGDAAPALARADGPAPNRRHPAAPPDGRGISRGEKL